MPFVQLGRLAAPFMNLNRRMLMMATTYMRERRGRIRVRGPLLPTCDASDSDTTSAVESWPDEGMREREDRVI
jgi:hypothetical protein